MPNNGARSTFSAPEAKTGLEESTGPCCKPRAGGKQQGCGAGAKFSQGAFSVATSGENEVDYLEKEAAKMRISATGQEVSGVSSLSPNFLSLLILLIRRRDKESNFQPVIHIFSFTPDVFPGMCQQRFYGKIAPSSRHDLFPSFQQHINLLLSLWKACCRQAAAQEQRQAGGAGAPEGDKEHPQ
ncbi:hypothetical protein DV515_00010355 [Chloebia gouldiae]|uniref:Uncharacterized protein n=1 Tax=Chloebia gouldiae TaxID=44316 RepID=A0A3L8S9S7_CHLGU|nr:hypothetical protein DV515_00010355 [Chloebia gouldiae]